VDRAGWAELAADYGEAASRHWQNCGADEIYDRLARASRIALRIAEAEIDEEWLLNRLATLEIRCGDDNPGRLLEQAFLGRNAFISGVNWVEEHCLGVWLHGRHWDAARKEAERRWPSPEVEGQNAD
jgi:hypothetical protein